MSSLSDPFRRVTIGDPATLQAATINTLVDANRIARSSMGATGAGPAPAGLDYPATIVPVLNNSSKDADLFDVLQIQGPLITATDGLDSFQFQGGFSCIAPTQPSAGQNIVITLEPIPAGEIGRAVMSGIVPAYISVADVLDDYADVQAGDTTYLYSTKAPTSAQILTKEDGTGYKWAVLRIGNPLVPRVWICQVVNTGPGSAADLTGNMYWLDPKRPGTTDGNQASAYTDLDLYVPSGGLLGYGPIAGVNLAEASGSHGLATDGSVRVLAVAMADMSTPPVARWAFYAPLPQAKQAKITALPSTSVAYGVGNPLKPNGDPDTTKTVHIFHLSNQTSLPLPNYHTDDVVTYFETSPQTPAREYSEGTLQGEWILPTGSDCKEKLPVQYDSTQNKWVCVELLTATTGDESNG